MADRRISLSSVGFSESVPKKVNTEIVDSLKDSPNLEYDGKRLKWTNTYESLKKYVKEKIGIRGKWTSPGGGSKKFISSDHNLSLTWYHKKQQTLLFQGREGNNLKETLINLKISNAQTGVQQSVTTADSPTLSSSFTTIVIDEIQMSPVQIERPTENVSNSREINVSQSQRVNAENENDSSNLSARCSCSCGVLAADIEGIKLEIVILQKEIEKKADRDTDKSSSKEIRNNKNCLEHELSEEKESRKLLERKISMMVEERNIEINDYNKTILSLEDRASKAENERDSLRLALSLIMQDKAGSESPKPTKSIINDRPWQTAKSKSGQDEERQPSVKTKIGANPTHANPTLKEIPNGNQQLSIDKQLSTETRDVVIDNTIHVNDLQIEDDVDELHKQKRYQYRPNKNSRNNIEEQIQEYRNINRYRFSNLSPTPLPPKPNSSTQLNESTKLAPDQQLYEYRKNHQRLFNGNRKFYSLKKKTSANKHHRSPENGALLQGKNSGRASFFADPALAADWRNYLKYVRRVTR